MNILANLEASFARVIGTILPDTPAQPEHSTDSTGVITGNGDLGAAEWTGRTAPDERAPLPIYPQPSIRPMNPAHVRAAMDAMLARVDADLAVADYASAVHGRLYADGILPDRRKSVRAGGGK